MKQKLYIVIGAFGSGKSEYSINLAKKIHDDGKEVTLVDLDIVNPYFRSRDVIEQFQKEGIEVVAPEGENRFADLPMLSPKIRGNIENTKKTVVLDVGGDPSGCRTLSRYEREIKNRGYEMQFIVNTKRPFTSKKDDILKMMEQLEAVSKMKITEILCNTNLMEFTEEKTVVEGIKILIEVERATNLKFDKFLVLDKYADKIPAEILGKKKIVMNYFLNKPWELPAVHGI